MISRIIIKVTILIGLLLTVINLRAQQPVGEPAFSRAGDTLDLDQVMDVVMKHYPAIRQAEESLNHADAEIGLARSGYYPNVDATVNASHVGPVPSLEIPNMGTFKLFPENNFDAGVEMHQNIYDFGKTADRVSISKEQKVLAQQKLENTRQQIAIQVVQNYYTLVFIQEAIRIKEEQLTTLNQHLEFVQKKKSTGSGTDYEILSTQVRITNTENQKLDLLATRDVQLARLNALMGLPVKEPHIMKDTLTLAEPEIQQDSLVGYALLHRTELQMAHQQTDLAQLNLKRVSTENNPSVNFIANGGWKNGFVPDINKIKANYMVGLGIRIPVFDATRLKYNKMAAKSEITSSQLQTNLVERNISSEVVENETRKMTAAKKVDQTNLQLRQAEEAYKLAEVNYSAGAITNLELLDASTAVSRSKLAVLKSKVDYVISLYRLNMSLGNTIY